MKNITDSFYDEFFENNKDFQDHYFNQEDLKVINKDSLRVITNELHIIQDLIKTKMVNIISFAKPMLMHGKTGIIHPNSINIIKGEVGAPKRRLVETICSVLLSNQGIENSLGFNKNQLDHFQLLYVDTERNVWDQLPCALHQILIKAGYPKTPLPRSFSFIGLAEINREIRFEVLRRYLRIKHNKPNYHLFVVLNVSSDFIPDSDNPEHTMKLIDLMKNAVNNSNCTFLCIIHEDPSSEKAIGHLESELMKVSSTIMQSLYDKLTGLIEVKFLTTGNIEKPASIFCKYSDALKALVLAENNEQKKSEAEDLAVVEDLFLTGLRE